MRLSPFLYLSVEKGNFLYFFFIAFLFAGTFLCRSLCRHFGKKFAHEFVLVLLWMNFAFHFLKQLNPFYLADFPFSIGRSSLENFCALLICAAPFIYLSKNRYLKDYLYYVGLLSGIVVYLIPTGALGRDLSSMDNLLETIRFYGCHFPLVAVPVVMVDAGLHELDYHRLPALPFLFVAANAIVLLNGVLMSFVFRFPGWPHTLEEFIDRAGFVNQSATFGPPPSLDPILGWLYPYLIPGLMTFVVDGTRYFTPCVYLFFPVALVTLVFGPVLCFPFEKRHMKLDLEGLRQKAMLRRRNRGRR